MVQTQSARVRAICKYLYQFKQFIHTRNMGSSNCKSFSPSKVVNTKHEKTEKMTMDEDYVEGIVCQEGDLKDNEMKSFDLMESGRVLIVKQNGVLSALGAKCTHYGAPLANGVLGNGRIRCQWHGACFNATTGDIEDFPGLDSLPCYLVSVENGAVKVRAKKSELSGKRVKPMSHSCGADNSVYVIIGGGPSGATCVETLRQNNYQGRIVMVCAEQYLPYDRIKVSKSMDFDITSAQFRTMDFYKNISVEVMLHTSVTALNAKAKQITLSKGKTLSFNKCYIATGSKPRVPDIPGVDLTNVCTLRNYEDSKFINDQLTPETHIVILGSSFIGLEAAAFCVGKVAKITLIGKDSVPLLPVFGEQIGARIKTLFEEKGVEMVMNSGIAQCIGEANKLTTVELTNGSRLKADLCIMGIGSTLYTDFLKESGITLNSNGSVPVNEYMETNDSSVYAGGDIAYAPVFANNNKPASIGHYPLAQYHGRIAALNMLGKQTRLKSVPYFWTVLFGKSIRYTGYSTYDTVHLVGDLAEMKFIAYYLKDDQVTGMASCQRDPVVSQYAEILAQGKSLNKAHAEDESLQWTKMLLA